MSKKINLSFKEGKTFLYIIISGILFVLTMISIVLYKREKYLDLVFLLFFSISLILFVIIYLLKLNKLNSITFDDEFVYVNIQEKVFKRSDTKEIKYFFLSASFIKFKNDDRKYYFLVDQNELFFRKKRKVLISSYN